MCCRNLRKRTAYVFQSDCIRVAPTRRVARSRTNFYPDIARRLKSRDNNQDLRSRIYIYVYVINPDVAAKRQTGKCHEIIRRRATLHLARFPSAREGKSSFSMPAGIIIHLRKTSDRAEERIHDPSLALRNFSPREDGRRGIHLEKEYAGRASFW